MIVVSHRGPFSFRARDDGGFEARRGAGGVVSALGPLLLGDPAARAVEGPVRWVAAAISDDDRDAVVRGAARVDEIELRLLALDRDDHRAHYEVVSNSVLWFTLHELFDRVRRPRFDPHFFDAWAAYERVNEAFAEAVAEIADPNEVVLVQDYQLLLVPGMLRARRRDLRTVLFVHTPWGVPATMEVLPDGVASAIAASMAEVPVGFHTERWAEAFTAWMEVVAPASSPTTFVAPLGPDRAALEEVATSDAAREAGARIDELRRGRRLVVRSDRIEPSKNLVRGFLAFDLLLERAPQLRGDVVFAAMVYGSREGLPEYLAYRHEVEAAAEAVNRRWGTDDWSPVELHTDDDFPRSIAALARADVLFVNPMKDGLNLVAKEGPLVNTRDAVLCLSPEAGAWAELGDAALSTHPYDLVQAAETLERALTMDPDHRRDLAAALRARAGTRTPADWLRDQLAHAPG